MSVLDPGNRLLRGPAGAEAATTRGGFCGCAPAPHTAGEERAGQGGGLSVGPSLHRGAARVHAPGRGGAAQGQWTDWLRAGSARTRSQATRAQALLAALDSGSARTLEEALVHRTTTRLERADEDLRRTERELSHAEAIFSHQAPRDEPSAGGAAERGVGVDEADSAAVRQQQAELAQRRAAPWRWLRQGCSCEGAQLQVCGRWCRGACR